MTEWVVVAASNRAKIYSRAKPYSDLILLKELTHETFKLKNTAFVSDRSGRYKTLQTTRHVLSPETEPKKKEQKYFSKRIIDSINQGRNMHQFSQLTLIAEPHFLGMLKEDIEDSPVEAYLKHTITKNYIDLTDKELKDALKHF